MPSFSDLKVKLFERVYRLIMFLARIKLYRKAGSRSAFAKKRTYKMLEKSIKSLISFEIRLFIGPSVHNGLDKDKMIPAAAHIEAPRDEENCG